MKKDYDYVKKIIVITKEKINIEKDYIVEQKNEKDKIEFKIDTRKIELNKFISYITDKISIEDLEIENNNIDDIIVKLYEDFGI